MLSKSDINYMINKAKKITKITTCEIRYRELIEADNEEENNNDFDYSGYGGYPTGEDNDEEIYEWSEWDDYQCSIETADEYNINDYPFGNIKEGDLILLLPKDTSLPTRALEYEIKFNDDIYVAKTNPKEMGYVGDKFLYYALVGGIK